MQDPMQQANGEQTGVAPALPPIPPGGGGDDDDQLELGELTLNYLTADPDVVAACGNDTSTLGWNVTDPNEDLAITYWLGVAGSSGARVQASGQEIVTVFTAVSYVLTARLRRARRVLGFVVISASNNPNCRTNPHNATYLAVAMQTILTGIIDKYLPAGGQISLDSVDQPVPDTDGFHITAHFKTAISDTTVDLTITLFPIAEQGKVVLHYTDFSVQVHVPFWLNIIAPGLITVLEKIVDQVIIDRLKPKIPQDLDAFSRLFVSAGYAACKVQMDAQNVNVTECLQQPPNLVSGF